MEQQHIEVSKQKKRKPRLSPIYAAIVEMFDRRSPCYDGDICTRVLSYITILMLGTAALLGIATIFSCLYAAISATGICASETADAIARIVWGVALFATVVLVVKGVKRYSEEVAFPVTHYMLRINAYEYRLNIKIDRSFTMRYGHPTKRTRQIVIETLLSEKPKQGVYNGNVTIWFSHKPFWAAQDFEASKDEVELESLLERMKWTSLCDLDNNIGRVYELDKDGKAQETRHIITGRTLDNVIAWVETFV